MMFLRRWGLERLVHWQLPVPVLPTLVSPNLLANELEPAGVSLFIPWYLLVDKSLTLEDLMSFHRQSRNLKHVAEWLVGGPQKWGYERFSKMLEYHVYCGLALGSRYPDRLKQNRKRLDLAFAAYWSNSSVKSARAERQLDSARRIRLMANQRLRH